MFYVKIFTLQYHSPAIKHKKNRGKYVLYFPMKDSDHVTKKLTLIFVRLLGVCCRFSINIIIEVHFFVCIGKWEDTGRV